MQAMTADTDVPAPLVRWLDSVPAGATTMLVEGEAGIGKTTFLRAGIEAARARG